MGLMIRPRLDETDAPAGMGSLPERPKIKISGCINC